MLASITVGLYQVLALDPLLPEKVAFIAKGAAPNVPKSSVALLCTLPRPILPSTVSLNRPHLSSLSQVRMTPVRPTKTGPLFLQLTA